MRSQAHSFRSAVAHTLAGSIALAVGASVVFAGADPDGGRPSPEKNPPGEVMAQGLAKPADASPVVPSTPDMKAVHDLIGRSTEAVVSGNGSELIGCLSRTDRERIGTPGEWADVHQAAEAFRSAWQARFGVSFKLSDKIPTVMAEPNVHVSGLEPTPDGPTTSPTVASKKTASVVLKGPALHSATAIKLVNEGTDKPDWRFDLPDTVSADTLHDSLLQHLKAVTASSDRWPTDVDQAYVYATQHLLAAIGDAAPPR